MQKYADIHEKSRLFRKMDVHTQLSDLVTNITLISKQEFNLASVDNKYTFIQMRFATVIDHDEQKLRQQFIRQI